MLQAFFNYTVVADQMANIFISCGLETDPVCVVGKFIMTFALPASYMIIVCMIIIPPLFFVPLWICHFLLFNSFKWYRRLFSRQYAVELIRYEDSKTFEQKFAKEIERKMLEIENEHHWWHAFPFLAVWKSKKD